jgi:hypothetical protein
MAGREMADFQFGGQEKLALVAIENAYTDFPDDKEYKRQLADGTWICGRVPVTIDTHWKEWIGTIHLERFENSNLVMIASEGSVNPQLLDEHHQKLKKRLSQTFSLLQLSGVLEYDGANLLCGSFFDGKSEIRQISEFPFFYQTRGYSRTPVTLSRLEKAVQQRKALEEMDSSPHDFKRLKWGWRILMDGLQKEHGEERIHQFVRSLEALILPEIAKTKRQFTHRCQTFAKASPDTKPILEEAFELRSMAEHLNDWEQALESYPKDDREIVALHRTRQMEQLAAFAYSRVLESDTIRNHFISETKQGEFWKLPDDARRNVWGTQLDLRLIKEVRSFDSWGRAL